MNSYRDLRPTITDRGAWTIPHTLRLRARTHAGRTYLSVPEDGVSLTYAATLAAAERVASGLLAQGLIPGERVLVMAGNTADAAVAGLGVLLAGLVEVPLNTAYRGDILAHQVRTVAPAGAILEPRFAERVAALGEAAATLRHVMLLEDEDRPSAERALRGHGAAVAPFEQLAAAGRAELPSPCPSDLGAIIFTSGTTGPSKGVAMPHGQLYFFADQGVSMTRLTDADTYLATTPIFHANAKVLAGYGALVAGAGFTLRRRFSATRWLEQVRADGATVTNLVGVMMEFVRRQPQRPDDADNPLRCVRAGPTSGDAAAFRERFGIDSIVEAFGSTECSSPILTPYDARERRPPGTAGLAVEEWFDVRLRDPATGEEAAPGAVGELLVRPRAPWIMSTGYFAMPEATLASRADLWFHTGDALRRDEQGWFTFVDRLSDTMRRRGENISSHEVEAPLLAHPAVAECAVVAVPAGIPGGEDEVLAVLVPAEGVRLDPAELWAWCDERLPDFCVPRYLRVVDHLPKTPSEKVRKSLLRAEGVTANTADRLAGRLTPPAG